MTVTDRKLKILPCLSYFAFCNVLWICPSLLIESTDSIITQSLILINIILKIMYVLIKQIKESA